MTQTLALFYAAYRELNARKLFWITLIISGLLVGAFAVVGINEKGLTILWWEFQIPGFNSTIIAPGTFYKLLFTGLGVGFWLSWLATILALVSTASIVPDMVSGGSIDILLSKPIGRARLFLTRYATALLFVTIQVSVFTVASFVVIGLRGDVWEPWVLIAIPLVVVFFSYLYCVCALVGVLTRSTIASLLITILFWLLIFGVGSAEGVTLLGKTSSQMVLEYAQEDYEVAEEQGDPTMIEPAEVQLTEAKANHDTWVTAHTWFYWAKIILPKTDETIGLLERVLRKYAGMDSFGAPDENETRRVFGGGGSRVNMRELGDRLQEVIDARSIWWIVGTSLLFEAFILGFACWRFSRRDF